MPGLSTAIGVAAGHYHSLALMADGTVRAWGYNGNGQLGDGTTTNRPRPVTVKALSGVVQVAGGRDLSLALKSDGAVWTWGLNSSGELGNGTKVSSDRAGSVMTWGENNRGQLGDGGSANRTTAQVVAALASVTTVGCGRDQVLAVTTAGQLWD